jgi:hypothetical protein
MKLETRVADAIEKLAEDHGATVKYKEDSLLMKIIGWPLSFINKTFSSTFATTIGKTIYLPSKTMKKRRPRNYSIMLAHELMHVVDHKNDVMFGVKYLCPQVLGFLALLAIPFSLFNLLWLLCFFPWPAYWRTKSESRGYAVTIAMIYWLDGSQTKSEWMVKHFTGGNYYYMWPFEDDVKRDLDAIKVRVANDDILNLDPLLVELKEIIARERANEKRSS